jgi:hypothetical protein
MKPKSLYLGDAVIVSLICTLFVAGVLIFGWDRRRRAAA